MRRYLTSLVALALLTAVSCGEVDRPARLLQATVTRVIDGDTLQVNINGRSERVRIIGVDAPETVHPDKPVEFFGPEASAFAEEKLSGRTVWLEEGVDKRCKHGRLLAYVWMELPTTGTEAELKVLMFNAHLLLDGYAQVSTFPPNVKYVETFMRFQQEAQENNQGLWRVK